jgi:hypothetical protein
MRATDRRTHSIAFASALVLLLFFSFGCGPPPSTDDATQPSGNPSVPELTEDVIRERINFGFVRDIPEDGGTGEKIHWTFVTNEPKEIVVVEKQIEGEHATIVLDVKTQTRPRSRSPISLAGQIRTKWALRTGWVLRQWEITGIENISMKYKKLEKPPEQNSNQEPL